MDAQDVDFQEDLIFVVTTLAWSPDSKKIAVGSSQYTESGINQNALINIVDGTTHEVIKTLHTAPYQYASMLYSLFWDSKGEILCAPFDGKIHLYDVISGKLLRTYPKTSKLFAISPTGTQIAILIDKGTLEIQDAATGNRIISHMLPKEHDGELLWVAWSPDGRQLLTVGRKGIVRIWDGEAFEQIREWAVGEMPSSPSAAWSPDSTRIAITSNDGHVQQWSASGKLLQTLVGHGVSGFGYELIWNSRSNRLVGMTGGGIAIWDAITGEPVKFIEAGVSAMDVSRDGRLIYGESILIEALNADLLPEIRQINLMSLE